MTSLEKVRLLISDVGGEDGKSFLFEDKEIEAFLDMGEADVGLAAAIALRTIAGNEAQVLKRIKFLELETNGPAVAEALFKLADKLDGQSEGDIDFEIAQIGADLFSRRQLRYQGLGVRDD